MKVIPINLNLDRVCFTAHRACGTCIIYVLARILNPAVPSVLHMLPATCVPGTTYIYMYSVHVVHTYIHDMLKYVLQYQYQWSQLPVPSKIYAHQ